MIESAAEFVRLRSTADEGEYSRAAHDEAPIEVWREVIDRFPDMRVWVAHNKTVPIEILALLVQDPDSRVRWMIATKRKATSEMLHALAAGEDETVRARVAWNPSTERPLILQLVDDRSAVVRAAALDRLGTA